MTSQQQDYNPELIQSQNYHNQQKINSNQQCKECNCLKKKVKQLQYQYNQLIEQSRKNFHSIEQQILDSNLQKMNHIGHVNSLQTKIFQLEKSIIEQNQQISSLNDQLQYQHASASKMSLQFLKRQVQFIELKQKCDQGENPLIKQIQNLKIKLNHQQEKYKQLSEICLDKDKRIIELRTKVKGQQKYCNDQKIKLKPQIQKKIFQNSAQIIQQDYKNETHVPQASIVQQKQILQKDKNQLKQSQMFGNKLQQIQSTIEYQKKKNSTLSQQNLQKGAQITELRKQMIVLQGQNKKYQQELNEYKKKQLILIEENQKSLAKINFLQQKQIQNNINQQKKRIEKPKIERVVSSLAQTNRKQLNSMKYKSPKGFMNNQIKFDQSQKNMKTLSKRSINSKANKKLQSQINGSTILNESKKLPVSQSIRNSLVGEAKQQQSLISIKSQVAIKKANELCNVKKQVNFNKKPNMAKDKKQQIKKSLYLSPISNKKQIISNIKPSNIKSINANNKKSEQIMLSTTIKKKPNLTIQINENVDSDDSDLVI